MPRARQSGDVDELDVLALAAAPVPERLLAALSLRVLIVGPVAVITAPARPQPRSIENALRRQHAIVLALAERLDPLLPARFGSRMTRAGVEATLRPAVDVVARALDQVRGRRQMTIRFAGPAAVAPASDIVASGTAYLAHRRALVRAVPAPAAPLLSAVAPFTVEQRVQPGRGNVHTTVFHLVGRDDISPYRKALLAARPRIAPWTAALSGPWPAFAFAPELIG
jgi:hypothetical protein